MMIENAGQASEDRTAKVVAYQAWLFNVARIYELSEEIEWRSLDKSGKTRYVVVSVNLCCSDTLMPEAMAFACDASGNILPDEVMRATVASVVSTDHDDAVASMGFRLLPPEAEPPTMSPSTREEVDAFNEKLSSTIVGMLESIKQLDRLRAQMATLFPEEAN